MWPTSGTIPISKLQVFMNLCTTTFEVWFTSKVTKLWLCQRQFFIINRRDQPPEAPPKRFPSKLESLSTKTFHLFDYLFGSKRKSDRDETFSRVIWAKTCQPRIEIVNSVAQARRESSGKGSCTWNDKRTSHVIFSLLLRIKAKKKGKILHLIKS